MYYRYSATFTSELNTLRSELTAALGASGSGNEEQGEIGSLGDEDLFMADDESQVIDRRGRKQRKKLSVFKNPKLKPALRYLQVRLCFKLLL